MSIARNYMLEARDGMAGELVASLRSLAASLSDAPGFLGAELARESDAPSRYHFIERWASTEAHREGAPFMSKEALSQMMACLAAKPMCVVQEELATFPGHQGGYSD
jgi:quinol monooxygenase YgiN